LTLCNIVTMAKIADKIFDECAASLPSLAGKCIAVTGTTSGTGFHACVAALRKDPAALLLLNRVSERSTSSAEKLKALAPNTVVQTVECDLRSFDSVRQAAGEVEKIAASYGGLDVICCNAGVMAVPDTRTKDGFETQMQTNHLSHFLLVDLLLSSLEAAASTRGESRVVTHSSGARRNLLAVDQVGMLKEEYFVASSPGTLGGDELPACFDRYHQTKLANSVMTMALHNKLQARGSKVKSVCAEPGASQTDLGSNLTQGHAEQGSDVTDTVAALMSRYPGMQSGADGACPLMFACFATDVASGDFFMPGDRVQETTCGMPVKCMTAGRATPTQEWMSKTFEDEKLTLDPANHELLWSVSVKAVGASN